MKIAFLIIAVCVFVGCSNKPKDRTIAISDSTHKIVECDFGIPKSELIPVDRNLSESEMIPPIDSEAIEFGRFSLKKNRSVVLLVFNGYVDSSGLWDYSHPKLVLDNSGFTTKQQKQILDTVKKDFRKFDVLITNYLPSFRKANPNKRQICVITKSYQWYYSKVAGVSYIGSFTWNHNPPVPDFVFSSLLNYNVKNVSKAIDHEIGHTLGLQHQALWYSCVLKSQYKSGLIMGYFYTPHPVWGIGNTPFDCQAIQNDTLIINQTLNR
jgi:hypothetical protein